MKKTKLGVLAIIMLIAVMLLTGCGNTETKTNDKKGDSLDGLPVYTAEETPDWSTFDKISGILQLGHRTFCLIMLVCTSFCF